MNTMNSSNSSELSYTEKDSKQEQIVHKRRSSVFQSRIITFDEDEGKKADVDDDAGCVSKTSQEIFNLKEYINSLTHEREEWIQTYKRRKTEQRSLTKKKAKLENEGQVLNLNILSDSDKAFITNGPNYQDICKNANKLSSVALKVSILNRMLDKVNQRFILQMEKRLYNDTKKIIKSS